MTQMLSYAAEAYELQQLRSAADSSVRLYKIALRWFDRFLGHPATMDDLNDQTFAKFCRWRRSSVAAATVNRDLVTLLSLWRWCHRNSLCPRWPNVPLEPLPERTPIAWTREEFSRLFAAAQKVPGTLGDVPANVWWPALLLTLFDTGERVGAVLQLTWNDVDLRQGWIRFRAETRKGRGSDSMARVAPDTRRWLRKLERARGTVFLWPLSRTHLWTHYGRLLMKAGLPDDRLHKFHCVRKTTASHLEAAGGNATDALRHSSRRITLVYLDPRICQPPQPVDRLWRPE